MKHSAAPAVKASGALVGSAAPVAAAAGGGVGFKMLDFSKPKPAPLPCWIALRLRDDHHWRRRRHLLRRRGTRDQDGHGQRGVVNENSAHASKYKPKGKPKRKPEADPGIRRGIRCAFRANTVANA